MSRRHGPDGRHPRNLSPPPPRRNRDRDARRRAPAAVEATRPSPADRRRSPSSRRHPTSPMTPDIMARRVQPSGPTDSSQDGWRTTDCCRPASTGPAPTASAPHRALRDARADPARQRPLPLYLHRSVLAPARLRRPTQTVARPQPRRDRRRMTDLDRSLARAPNTAPLPPRPCAPAQGGRSDRAAPAACHPPGGAGRGGPRPIPGPHRLAPPRSGHAAPPPSQALQGYWQGT